MPSATVFTAIEEAFRADGTLPGLCPGGIEFEVATPGTTKPRVVFHLPDDGIEDVRGYGGIAAGVKSIKRTYRFLFTVYADTFNNCLAIVKRLTAVGGPYESVVFGLTSPEVSGGGQWATYGRRFFKNKTKRNEPTATYEYVAELVYETIVNNPQC